MENNEIIYDEKVNNTEENSSAFLEKVAYQYCPASCLVTGHLLHLLYF
jgi:hypothetical protein